MMTPSTISCNILFILSFLLFINPSSSQKADLLTSETFPTINRYDHVFILYYDINTDDYSFYIDELNKTIQLYNMLNQKLSIGFYYYEINNISKNWLLNNYNTINIKVLPNFQYYNKNLKKWYHYSTISAHPMLRFIGKKLNIDIPKDLASEIPKNSNVFELKADTLQYVERNIENLVPVFSIMSNLSNYARNFYQTKGIEDRKTILKVVKSTAMKLTSMSFASEFIPTVLIYVNAMEESFGKDDSYFIKNYQKYLKMANSHSVSMEKRNEYGLQASTYRNFLESIPKIIHFIKTDPIPDNFKIIHYISIRSAYHYIKPDILYFHTAVMPKGRFWDRLVKEIPSMIINVKPPPIKLGSKLAKNAAHQSDILRLELLMQHGGIYMDWDVLVTHSFDTLLNQNVVFGKEKLVPEHHEVLGVAVIMSRSGEKFLDLWQKHMEDDFNPETCYACHSVVLSRKLALIYPQSLTILDYKSFYHPGWDKISELFRTLPHPFGSAENFKLTEEYFAGTYASHLFESSRNFYDIVSNMTEEKIKTVDTYFNIIVRKFFE